MRTFFYAITVVDILIHYLFAVPNAVTSENSRHFEMKSKIVYILFRGFHYVVYVYVLSYGRGHT